MEKLEQLIISNLSGPPVESQDEENERIGEPMDADVAGPT